MSLVEAVSRPARAEVDTSYIDAREELMNAQARQNFWAFRQAMRPDMLWGWWVQEIALALDDFFADFVAGRRPKMAIMAPPQHGKSWSAEDFAAYCAGRLPEYRTIFGSYSDGLGVRCNLSVQRMMKSPRYQQIFPTRIDKHGWICNTERIEYVGHMGSFMNTTVGGAINGFGLHLGIIDDPVKGRAEASSPAVSETTWNWFTNDFFGRFADNGAMLVIMTRWTTDDLLGRFLEKFGDETRVISYPAIAEEREKYRRIGDPLFPELKSKDFLLERKKLLTVAGWQSIWQQRPFTQGGGIFPVDKIRTLTVAPRREDIRMSVRAWDKSATPDGGDYSVGVLMHYMKDGTFVVEHVARGQMSVLERERAILSYAHADRASLGDDVTYEVVVEQEPGSGGKESVEATIRNLAGFNVYADKVSKKKLVRAEPFAAQVQGGNVAMLAGLWQRDYLEELEMFDSGPHDDQVDASSMAFNRLALGATYNLDALAS